MSSSTEHKAISFRPCIHWERHAEVLIFSINTARSVRDPNHRARGGCVHGPGRFSENFRSLDNYDRCGGWPECFEPPFDGPVLDHRELLLGPPLLDRAIHEV
jgi:hypothetical protein